VKRLRIVSLLPGATEMVCALDLSSQLAGRSHECDFPPSIRQVPICTEPRINPYASSAQIDREVKTRLRDALSLYRIDVEKLQLLRPDVILTQARCDACAVSLTEVEHAVSQWIDCAPRILSLTPQKLADLWSDLLRVAEALGVDERGRRLAKQLKGRVADIIEKSCRIKRPPSVACIEWLDPLMAAGNWVPELVELAGGLNLFGEAGKHSPWLNWEAVQEHDPEVLVVMACGFNLARTRQEMPALMAQPDWAKLRAVQHGRVFLTDGNQYFNRPGPRLVESLEILAEIIHPKAFPFGHEGSGWQRL
jgi:iron complex transport system substrate-binding protein